MNRASNFNVLTCSAWGDIASTEELPVMCRGPGGGGTVLQSGRHVLTDRFRLSQRILCDDIRRSGSNCSEDWHAGL
eukprot:5255439-Amphidinium_carterae.3